MSFFSNLRKCFNCFFRLIISFRIATTFENFVNQLKTFSLNICKLKKDDKKWERNESELMLQLNITCSVLMWYILARLLLYIVSRTWQIHFYFVKTIYISFVRRNRFFSLKRMQQLLLVRENRTKLKLFKIISS